jgi:ABC-type transporter Mla MlaB component
VLLKAATLLRIQSILGSIRILHLGPDGTQRGSFVIRQEPSEQLISVDEPQEVSSASTLAGKIREALLQPGNLCIDFQGAGRIHTAVLQVLVAAQRACSASERSLAISGAAPELQPLLQIAGLSASILA